jgi:uncharacterized repeat protein (TIGR01451 family)
MNKMKHGTRRLVILILVLLGVTSFMALPSQFSSGAGIENEVQAGRPSLTGQPKPEKPFAQKPDPETLARLDEAYGKLPLSFEANRGQFAPEVKFISHHSNSALFLTSGEAVLVLKNPRAKKPDNQILTGMRKAGEQTSVLRMKVLGANSAAQIEGLDPLTGKSNYFRGKDPSKWQTDIANYTKVQVSDVYKGVKLIYYGNQRQLEYDFVVASGADPGTIKLAFEGAQKIRIDANGDLVLRTKVGDIRLHKPYVYQETEGIRQAVGCRYVLKGKHQVGFEVAAYDKGKTLVIDPVLSYSTFLGGNSYDEGRSIAVDASGNAYVTGYTSSFNFPVAKDAFNSTYANSNDVFVTKMNAAGSDFIYSTYLGGTSDEYGYDITVDSAGSAYLTGVTYSMNFPTTAGAYDTVYNGNYSGDAFVTKLNSTGTALDYSTFLGGTSAEQGNSIAIDSSGNAYVAGPTYSSNFPTTAGAYRTVFGGSSNEIFITKLDSAGAALMYSTFLGGANSDQASSIAIDSSNNAYVTGNTNSANFPTTAGALQTVYGGGSNSCCYNILGDAFVTKLNVTGTDLLYSTYLGGSSDESGSGIAVAPSGEVYLTGTTTSVNFPTTPGVIRVGNGGVAKTTDGSNSWMASNTGITQSTITTLAIDPSTPTIVYAGTLNGGVFKSIDGGASWSASNSGLTDLNIQALAIHPATPSTMYLGTSNRGVFKSTNSGNSWRAINTGQNGTLVNELEIDPATPSTIYAGTNQRVFKTTNSGASWTASDTGLSQVSNVYTLAIDPITTSTLYAGFYYGGVYKSTDGGNNWNATNLVQAGVKTLAIDPAATSTLYAGTDNGVLKSTDGGNSWNGINTGLTNRVVNALEIFPTDTLTIYAGTGNGVFKSTNGGNTWSSTNSGLAGAFINALAIDSVMSATIYSGSATGGTDAFVSRLNSTGTALIYSTYLGGSSLDSYGGYSYDQGNAIAIDSSGNAYVTGYTTSRNFPTTKGAFQAVGCCSDSEGFVSKLNSTGATLAYSTYLGGNSSDQGYGIAVDASDNAFVTGTTQSQNFPITDEAYQSTLNNYSYSDAFISKFVAAPALTSDLSIAITATPESGDIGSSIRYDITVTNIGPDRASAVVITDDLPSSTAFYNCSSSTVYCNQVGNNVTFTINSLEVDASVTVTIFATVSCSIPGSAMIENTATVDSSALDANTGNNSASVTTTAINPTTTLSPTSQMFTASGGSNSVNVNRGANCNWAATSNVDWITITYSSNCCNGTVYYNVAANPGGIRTGTMTIAGLTFTVDQLPGNCSYSLSATDASFSPSAGVGSVNVIAAEGCAWQATSNAFWIQVTSGSSGSGNGTVTYTVDNSPSGTFRSGTITIADQTFTVHQGNAFLDVPPSHPFYNEIGKLSARGITIGCGGGNYCPDEVVTREQMAAFIIRALGEFNPPTPPSQRFTDVPPENPFYAFIEEMALRQITLGCGGNNYCPTNPVSREEMAAFLIRALHDPGYIPPPPASQRFNDVPPEHPFYAHIEEMAVLGITLGCSANPPLYCPTSTVTRAQMAAFLVRAFNL